MKLLLKSRCFKMGILSKTEADKSPKKLTSRQMLKPSFFDRIQDFWKAGITLQRIRGSILFGLGYLLSPLCWWNDLLINLPIAYGVGYLCNLIHRDSFFVGAIIGYWLSNFVGFMLMQVGAVEVLQDSPKARNPQKEFLVGLASSTLYTLVIVTLVQFKVLDMSMILPGQ